MVVCKNQSELDAAQGPDADLVIEFAVDQDATVRVLRNLIVDSCRNLRADGATIGGTLWADGAKIVGTLRADGATIGGTLWAGGAKIGGDLRADGATIGGTLWAGGATIGGDLWAGGATIGGTLWAGGATIGGDLWADYAQIGRTLWADGATIGGTLWAGGATIGGDLWADGATIGGTLWAVGATIGDSLWADGATIGGVLIGDATPIEAALLDRIADDFARGALDLMMDNWHGPAWSKSAHPGYCGTTHCLAGAAQALSADPEIRAMRPLDAGRKLLPSASYLFFAPQETVERYLRSRPWRVASA